jgi:hypothetical protein
MTSQRLTWMDLTLMPAYAVALMYAYGLCDIDGIGLCFAASMPRQPRPKKTSSALHPHLRASARLSE